MTRRNSHHRLTGVFVITLFCSACSWQNLVRWDHQAPAETTSDVVPAEAVPPKPVVKPALTEQRQTPRPKLHRPTIPSDLWAAIADATVPSDLSRPEVQQALTWYRGQRKYLRESATRATPYLHFIWTEVRRRDLPIATLYIPLLESGYRADVVSPYGAAGLWQFIGATGTKLGLAKNAWLDERLDIVASTWAATDYLADLMARFDGDWLLAVAAYNAGWGSIEKALEKNRRLGRPTDFWSLDLRRETRQLVARTLALNEIFRDPKAFGLNLAKVPDEPYFKPVVLRKPTDLRRLSQVAKIDQATFQTLNPAFKSWHTGPNLPKRILVPANIEPNVAALAQNLEPSPLPHATPVDSPFIARNYSARDTYHVQKGDSLWLIARRFDMHVSDLERLNAISRTRPLRLGQPLTVLAPAASVARESSRVSAATAQRYQVRSGDSLWTISRRFKVTIAQLVAWNNLRSPSALKLGQELLVSKPT